MQLICDRCSALLHICGEQNIVDTSHKEYKTTTTTLYCVECSRDGLLIENTKHDTNELLETTLKLFGGNKKS